MPKRRAWIGMLASLPRWEAKSRLPGSRLFRVSPGFAEAAGLGSPGDAQGHSGSLPHLNNEGHEVSVSRGRLESHPRPSDADSESARRCRPMRAGPRRRRSFRRAPRPG